MRKLILFAIAVALLAAAPAYAANRAAMVEKIGKNLVVTCTSPDTLAANTADNFKFLLADRPLLIVGETDATAPIWLMPVNIFNTTAAAADSVHIYIDTSFDGTTWLSGVVAVGNDNFALNGLEEKQSNILSKVMGPWVRIGVKAVGSATTARAVKIVIPLQ